MSFTADLGLCYEVGKAAPQIDFPAMKCSIHKREDILVCTK